MAKVLTNDILNNKISVQDTIEWIQGTNYKKEKFMSQFQLCSRKEFVTNFLNAIHDLSHNDRSTDTPQKPKFTNTQHNKTTKQTSFNGWKSPETSKTFPILNNTTQNTFPLSCTSTPNINKPYSYDSINSNLSPIHKSSTSFQKQTDNSKSTSLCLGDFIITPKKSTSKKKTHKKDSQNITPKRINPTDLTKKNLNHSFVKHENSFNFQNNNSADSNVEKHVHRDLLKQEIEKFCIKEKSTYEIDTQQEMKKITSCIAINNSREIFPNPKLVRFKGEIEKIILIYDYLLKNGFVFSLIGELYFIISLLFNKCYCECSDIESDVIQNYTQKSHVKFEDIFKSIHNVVYFACCMLQNNIFLLKSLDKSTLKFMSQNERLALYLPNLTKTVEAISGSKNERLLNLYEANERRNICFILDTDNRSNFPSDSSFQSFKKQRDLFYEILKIWEDGHMAPEWNFDYVLGRKIKLLLNYHKDPVNFMRLSRLFMDQLLSTCSRKPMEETSEETSSNLLTSLPHIDRDKFDRLNTRLVTKQSSNGINSAPDFSGYQEFYKEFLLISSNPIFLKHLCDTFICEIIDLNETNFMNLDSESTESESDQDTKKAFVNSLKSLRILAKFLGFIESMPYKTEGSSLPTNLIELEIRIREKVNPNFDVLSLLKEAAASGNVTLCIPWVCKYLSMLDSITLKTSYYSNTIKLLIHLYRSFGTTEVLYPDYNVYLVKYTLGWFFELSNFPHNIFFDAFSCDSSINIQQWMGIDKLKIVDQNILYIFCPFLEEIKRLLTSKTVTKDSVRHITPLTAVESPAEITKKRIEAQLEEAFFNGHPASLRKTVDFVAERIASTCVKHLCYTIVPTFKRQFAKNLQTKLHEWTQNEDKTPQDDLRYKCEKYAEENHSILENMCTTEVDKIVQNNLKTAIHSLLPLDCLLQMESVCSSVAVRLCLEKVKQWTSTHIVIGILKKEISGEMAKFSNEIARNNKTKPVFTLPPGGSKLSHNSDTESGAHVLDRLRDLSVSLLTNSMDLNEELLVKFLENVYKTLTERNDLSEAITYTICFQLLEFILLLITFQPQTVNIILNHCFKIWKLINGKSEELFSNLLCPRNIMILGQSGPNINNSWTVKANFCVAILKENLLSCESFESQCTGLFKNNLDEQSLKHITKFLKIFVELYRKECKSSKFTLLLEFLSDFCQDL